MAQRQGACSAFLTPEKALDLECALGSKIKTEKCAGGRASETPWPQMRKPARANGGFARGTRNRGGENHESNACEQQPQAGRMHGDGARHRRGQPAGRGH